MVYCTLDRSAFPCTKCCYKYTYLYTTYTPTYTGFGDLCAFAHCAIA